MILSPKTKNQNPAKHQEKLHMSNIPFKTECE